MRWGLRADSRSSAPNAKGAPCRRRAGLTHRRRLPPGAGVERGAPYRTEVVCPPSSASVGWLRAAGGCDFPPTSSATGAGVERGAPCRTEVVCPPSSASVGWLRAAGGCGLTPRRRLPLSLLLSWNVPLLNVGIVVGALRRNAMLSDVGMVVGMVLSLAVVVMMAGLKSLRGDGMVVGIVVSSAASLLMSGWESLQTPTNCPSTDVHW